MTHPLDRLYRFETPAQWGAGFALGLRRTENAGLATIGALRSDRLPGTSGIDGGALLTRDAGGRMIWMRTDGTVLRLAEGIAVELARIPPDLARGAVRLIWGQRIGWLVARGELLRLDTATGAEIGRFTAPGWRVEDAVVDTCDGVIAVERPDQPGASDDGTPLRLRRLRDDGVEHETRPEHPVEGSARAARSLRDGHATVVATGAVSEPWHVLSLAPDGTGASAQSHPADPELSPGGPLALSPDGRLTLATRDRRAIFAVAEGRVEPAQHPEPGCNFGEITDLIDGGTELIAATTTGLFRLTQSPEDAPPRRAFWLSPVLRSALDERRGWQRADLTAILPVGAELTISARGFDSASAAGAEAAALLGTPGRLADDAAWAEAGISRHPGRGTEAHHRHYLGEIGTEFLLLRIAISVPAFRGTARLGGLRVLYPNRSLIEALPAIYRDGGRSEKHMRRALAGLQAMIDEIDDRISEGASRIDPERADALWSGFLMHWLGHGALSRLPVEPRRQVLRALPRLMALRGTEAGLAGLLDILAPGQYAIEDQAAGPATWLLAGASDPAAPRLGRATRIGHTAPKPFRLGACSALGRHRLGLGCGGEPEPAGCSAAVTVRLFGGTDLKTRLTPFLDPIRRLFAPAHARLDFRFGDHRPPAGLGLGGPGLGEMRLDDETSRALGQWALPRHDPIAHPEDDAVLDSATLNGTLTLA